MTDAIQLHERQNDLIKLISNHKYTLAYGSSRGGKSYAFFYVMVVRALMFPGSNHCVIRSTAASIPSTIWPTALAVLKAIAPGYREEIDTNSSIRLITIHNTSRIWFFGAQDEDAVEKIMGAEFATIMLNEVVNLDLKTFQKIKTRLNADDVDQNGNRIALKMFADCNPKSKSHWVYQQWVRKVKPGSETPLSRGAAYASLQFDRTANPNVDADYYADMQDDSAEEQASYLLGEWYDEVEGALFSQADIDNNRDHLPNDFDLTVVAVDPAMTNTPSSDETGIIVAGAMGEGSDAHYFPIEDLSGRYHPNEWAKKAVAAYWEHGAKAIVVEVNQGGDQNMYVIHSIDPRVTVVTVRAGAGQGKNERAKPIASLMKAGRIHHPLERETFKELESQLLAMTGDYDRRKGKSPDRLDAYVYAISELLTGDGPIKPVVISKLRGYFS